jgi:site-specific recombinase XerD
MEALTHSGAYVLGIDARLPDGSAIARAWRATVRAVHEETPSVPAIRFHGLRHSFATFMAQKGVPLPILQALLGHANIQTTMIYSHVQPSSAVETARAVAGFLE